MRSIEDTYKYILSLYEDYHHNRKISFSGDTLPVFIGYLKDRFRGYEVQSKFIDNVKNSIIDNHLIDTTSLKTLLDLYVASDIYSKQHTNGDVNLNKRAIEAIRRLCV